MKGLIAGLCLLPLSLSTTCCAEDTAITVPELNAVIQKIRPLHETIQAPGPGDWRAQHKEPGQTFMQYGQSKPVTLQGVRNVIYIQPIGVFTKTQQQVVKLTADYMERYFGATVAFRKTLPLSAIPESAKRTHPSWGDRQILTTYVLNSVLQPNLPRDAAAMIAFTASDLWPGQNWNFVFGQASIRERVGVWSIYRNGDPETDAAAFKQCLSRTIKTAVHETGHMFSMRHCTAYECVMCGSNSLPESDRRPLYLCPEGVAKICWATQTQPIGRYRKLIEFCEKNGFDEDRAFFEASIKKLQE